MPQTKQSVFRPDPTPGEVKSIELFLRRTFSPGSPLTSQEPLIFLVLLGNLLQLRAHTLLDYRVVLELT